MESVNGAGAVEDQEIAEVPKYSLNHISKDAYESLYDRIKAKYVKDLKKIWTERTDPDKFIHEDVGIATYLMVLWGLENNNSSNLNNITNGNNDDDEQEVPKLEKIEDKSTKPNYIDIGCGNGLLTYLLTMEKYDGFGFDLRSRKIWKSFQPQPKLLISSFSPKNESELFKTAIDNNTSTTWLIGNHPDELTPWIPILARKYKCNFFIIPCCCYDFVGKYQRRPGDPQTSIYATYVQFVRKIGLKCGFKVVFDKLRIPSTKRTCLIGTLNENIILDKDPELSKTTLDYCESIIEKFGTTEAFNPRCAVEPVRNCTQIDRGIIKEIVDLIFNLLTSDTDERNNIEIQYQIKCPKHADGNDKEEEDIQERRASKSPKLEHFVKEPKTTTTLPSSSTTTTRESITTTNTVIWNAGKQDLKFKDAILLLTPEQLKHMKSQHGGFQTLMRNNGHIFSIIDGYIKLRKPEQFDINKMSKAMKNGIKTRRCYLYDNHPKKCPLPAEICRYVH